VLGEILIFTFQVVSLGFKSATSCHHAEVSSVRRSIQSSGRHYPRWSCVCHRRLSRTWLLGPRKGHQITKGERKVSLIVEALLLHQLKRTFSGGFCRQSEEEKYL